MPRLMSRDAFARQELHRSHVTVTSASCAWCGNVKRTRAGRNYLFAYHVATDGGRRHPTPRLFCSESCRATFN